MAKTNRMRLINDDLYRKLLLEWLLDNEDDECVSLVTLSKKIGLARPTIYKFMYSDKPVSLKTLSVIRNFLKHRNAPDGSQIVLTERPSRE